eukprot:gene5671-9492_t
MQEISKIANFTFESYTVADGKFGEKINGTWNGVMGELVSKRADVTFAPLTYTAERATDVSFSSPYLNIGLRLMSLKEKQKVNLTSFLSPFEWTVWLSVVGVIVLVGILLWIYDLLSPYGLSKIDNPELNLANAFLNSGIGMTGQLGNPGRSWATRILTLGYYLFLIIVTASYTANLTNVLTESSATSSLSSYRDITKGVYTGTIENSAVSLFLLTNPVYSVIKPFLKLYPTFDDLLVALRSKKIGAAIMDSPIVSFIAGNAPCDIQENGEVFGPANYALAAPENATYISELSTAVLQLKESGTIDLLIVKYLTSQGCTATASGTSIGFDKFGGVFVSFGILVVFCTLIIVVEICFAFIWKSFGDKFPFLFFIHEFFGGGAKFTQKEELKDTFNNTSENTGVNVDLSFNCISLETTSGKIPDPLVLCFIMERGLWKEIGRTEIGENTKNPTFKKKISLDFKFEEQQNLRFVVLNIDSERSIDVEEQEEIGSLFCTLADIIGSPGGNFQKSIESPSKKVKNCGILGIIGSGDEESSTQYLFKISAKNLDHFMGLLDPFLVVSRLGLDNETFVPIYKTETVFFSRKPRWKPFTLNYKILAKNDPKRPIKFDIYDFNSSGHHGYVGTVESSVQNLKYSPHVGDVAAVATLQTLKLTTKGKIFEVVNSDKYSKSKTYINSGLLEIEMTKHYDFFDYLRSGLEISLMVAIDFSGGSSYGINRFIKSIEEVDATVEESTTDFEESIQVVGSVLDKYDSDHRYPVYGFGVEGCDWFACNGDNNNPEVEGIEGVIKAYKSAQTTINPSRSSKFSPLIKKAGAYAKLSDDNYFILLILTHGLISDMTETINEIIDASNHPISIVIVGIGSSKFTEMIKLDGNETKLSNSDAKKVTRDIVQFVSFNKYKRNAQKLAEEVLGEIPHQIEQYLYMNDIQPEKFKKDLEHYENEHKDIESLDIKVIEEQPTEDISINIELPDVKIEEKKVEEEKVDEEKEKETAVKIEEPKVEIEQEKEEKTEEKVEQDEKVKIEEINQEGNE